VNERYKQEGKKRAGQPPSRKDGEHGVALLQVAVATHVKAARDGKKNEYKRRAIQKTRRNAQSARTPTRGRAPDRAIPKTLGKEDCRQDRQTEDDPKQKPAPVHRMLAILITPKFTTRAGSGAEYQARRGRL
jgi:hypothetical protein